MLIKGNGRCWMAWLMIFVCMHVVQAQDAAKGIVQRADTTRRNGPSTKNTPYVILISADGFRYDYMKQFKTPNLRRLARKGLRTRYMTPSFPSQTFPNHYTLVTGAYPAHHGLVANSFYDRTLSTLYASGDTATARDGRFYGAEPVWVTAEKQQILSACSYWVGSEATIQGIRPTYYYRYGEGGSVNDRLQAVKHWLQLPEERRPHLISFYITEVDHIAHYYGPDSDTTGKMVQIVDEAVGRLVRMVDSLSLSAPVHYLFVSDHGLAAVDTVHTIPLPDVDTLKYKRVRGDVIVSYYAKDTADISSLYDQLKAHAVDGYDVYLRTQMPAHWHYNQQDDLYNRIGDVVLVARYQKIFAWTAKGIYPGRHGYDPVTVKEMRATFMAWGPMIKKKKIPPFENVEVQGLVMGLLGLEQEGKTDGTPGFWDKLCAMVTIIR